MSAGFVPARAHRDGSRAAAGGCPCRRPKPPFPALLLAAALASAAWLGIGAVGANAADASAQRAQAESLIKDAHYREAVSVLDDLLRAAPDDGLAHEDRGLARWRALTETADGGDDGFATIQARMCLETENACPDAEAALADFGRAIALLAGPSRAKALSERAQIHLRLGHDALALADEDEAIRLDPDDAQRHEDRAILSEHLGDADGALADLDAVLRVRPDAGDDLVMRAELRRRKGDIAGARADLDEALSHVPPGPEPDWVEPARTLRRAVAAPGEAGMGADSGPLTVTHVETITDQSGRPALSVTFDETSAKRLATYTAAHVGSAIDVLVGGEVVTRPRILSPITGGVVVISGNFSPDEIERLRQTLTGGGVAMTLREAD